MIRTATGGFAIFAATALLAGAAAGQAPTPDKIYVRDKAGAVKSYEGILKFSPTGYQIFSPETNKVVAQVSPVDIVKLVPGDLPGSDRSAAVGLLPLEEKKTRKDYEAARLNYSELLQKAAAAPPKTKQYLAFKKAMMFTRVLDDADDDEWSKQVDPLIKEWAAFLNDYRSGWEIWPAARIEARLLTETGRFDELEKLWRRMQAKDVELPPDLRQEALLQMIDSEIRLGGAGYASAKQAADAALKAPDLGLVAKDKLAIYARVGQLGGSPSAEEATAAAKEIEEKIAASKEPTVRGLGYSMLGEVYLAAKRPRDAMWAFLWAETVYNADKDEVLKALVRLQQIFKGQMDDDREKLYKDKLRRFRQPT
jgi:hypothetical protein